MPNPKDVSLPSTQGTAAPYFANYVKDQLVNRFGPAKTFGGGLKVRTTLDVDLQGMARKAIASVLPPSDNGPTLKNPVSRRLGIVPAPGGAVAIAGLAF